MTRCVLRIQTGEVGVGYVGGRSVRKAEAAALADAMLQSTAGRDEVARNLLVPLRRYFADAVANEASRAAATRVEFYTVAREAGA